MPGQPRRQVIVFTLIDDQLIMDSRGDLKGQEVLWSLEQFKVELLSGRSRQQRPAIPGMLTADGKRLPS